MKEFSKDLREFADKLEKDAENFRKRNPKRENSTYLAIRQIIDFYFDEKIDDMISSDYIMSEAEDVPERVIESVLKEMEHSGKIFEIKRGLYKKK